MNHEKTWEEQLKFNKNVIDTFKTIAYIITFDLIILIAIIIVLFFKL